MALGFIGWKIYTKIKLANMREKAWEVNRRFYGGNVADWTNRPGGVIKFEDTSGKIVPENIVQSEMDKFRELPLDYMPPLWPVGSALPQPTPGQQQKRYYLDAEAKERRKVMF